MNKSLFQIQSEFQELANQLIESGGEITEEIGLALAINEADLQTKSTNYSFVIKQLDADCDTIDSEIKRLTALKKARTNSVDRLKGAIKQAMEFYQIEEIKTPLIKINFRKSKAVEIEDIEKLPAQYIKVTETESIDKAAIKAAIDAGEEVPGAILKENKNLQIK
jgi:hypothetical protein